MTRIPKRSPCSGSATNKRICKSTRFKHGKPEHCVSAESIKDSSNANTEPHFFNESSDCDLTAFNSSIQNSSVHTKEVKADTLEHKSELQCMPGNVVQTWATESSKLQLISENDTNILVTKDVDHENIFLTQSDICEQPSLSNTSTTGLATQLKEALRRNAHTIMNVSIAENRDYNTRDPNSSFYGLPFIVKSLFEKHHGITELYKWQKDCLMLDSVDERRNLLYSLPTSGGKTLVAEILALKEIICRHKNVLFIFPFICIVQEKVRSLSPFALTLEFSVEEYAGNKGQIPPRQRRKKNTIYIATIEKAHLLMNCLIDAKRVHEIGLVVVDEIHMLFDGGDRGANLEMLLTKLKLFPDIKTIGMSATISNFQDLAKFMNATVYKNDYRPVELKEYVKVENKLWLVDYQKHNEFNLLQHQSLKYNYSHKLRLEDPDHVIGLVSDVLPQHSCLIFCPTKKQCQNLALLLCRHFPIHLLEICKTERESLIGSLMIEAGQDGVCSILKSTIPFGVAYHHSGLTMEERRLIEEAYTCGTLYLLTCTSTLAAGVNLPAKRVIIRAPYVGLSTMSAAQYKQMVGRAGRAGFDSSGESILIVKPNEMVKVNDLLYLPEDSSRSSLFSAGSDNLQDFILSVISLQLSKDTEQIKTLVSQSIFGIQSPLNQMTNAVVEAVNLLLNLGLLKRCSKSNTLAVTSLGMAVVKSGIEIKTCNQLQQHLTRALKCISLLGSLHLLFLVTPFNCQNTLPILPHIYYSYYISLSAEDQEVAALIGVSEACVMQIAAGRALGKKVDKDVIQRFYVTLALYDLWNQTPLSVVAEKFQTHRGTLHSLITRTTVFSGNVCRFTQETPEFWALADILPNFVKQLQFCCQKELISLMELPAVKQGRARQLYQAGYKSLSDVARAEADELSRNVEYLPKKIASQIISSAKMLLLEKAEALQEEAECIIESIVEEPCPKI